MPEDFNITPLFDSTSLSTPRRGADTPRAAVPMAGGDALATALLTGILGDLAALKETMLKQAGFNQAFHEYATAQQSTLADLVGAGNAQVDVNRHQAESNAAQRVMNDEVLKLFERVNDIIEKANRQVEVLTEIDDRLHALDGKRSIALTAPAPEQKDKPE